MRSYSAFMYAAVASSGTATNNAAPRRSTCPRFVEPVLKRDLRNSLAYSAFDHVPIGRSLISTAFRRPVSSPHFRGDRGASVFGSDLDLQRQEVPTAPLPCPVCRDNCAVNHRLGIASLFDSHPEQNPGPRLECLVLRQTNEPITCQPLDTLRGQPVANRLGRAVLPSSSGSRGTSVVFGLRRTRARVRRG